MASSSVTGSAENAPRLLTGGADVGGIGLKSSQSSGLVGCLLASNLACSCDEKLTTRAYEFLINVLKKFNEQIFDFVYINFNLSFHVFKETGDVRYQHISSEFYDLRACEKFELKFESTTSDDIFFDTDTQQQFSDRNSV